MNSSISSSWTMDFGSVRDPPDENQLLEINIGDTANIAAIA